MMSRVGRDLERKLRSALVTRLQQLSIAFHDRTESGRLQAKVLRDVEQVHWKIDAYAVADRIPTSLAGPDSF